MHSLAKVCKKFRNFALRLQTLTLLTSLMSSMLTTLGRVCCWSELTVSMEINNVINVVVQ